MGSGPWPGVSQVLDDHPAVPLVSWWLSLWAPPSLKEQNLVRPELPDFPEPSVALGTWGTRALGWPCLTISQEEDEVLGRRLNGLQLFGNIQGLLCLLVPEDWVLLLRWTRGGIPRLVQVG